MSLEIFCEKFTEVLLTSDGTEIQVRAGRLVGRDHSVHSIRTTRAKFEGISNISALISCKCRAASALLGKL
jgi:hypothetical protein